MGKGKTRSRKEMLGPYLLVPKLCKTYEYITLRANGESKFADK